MELSISTALLAFVANVAAEVVFCETSDASPYLHNVQELVDNLLEAGAGERICLDYSLGSDDCGPTQCDWSGEGGAAWQLCKANGSQGLRCIRSVDGPLVSRHAAVFSSGLPADGLI
ncbi:hypothetical protein FZEAL_5148 [Fusarium zealandicum]|uniref:Uncharacterized protein n=1 Tax=Fusarium zealandicum TaxID=1053134 RepID=A0A8H4XL62_9HYPO|nr:hypothetical protein FZEAL_5148 [Fusarium zealandicum]